MKSKKQDNEKQVFLVKELTKLHQKSFKGQISEIVETFKTIDTRGEWVVIIDSVESADGEAISIDDLKALDIPPKQKAKLIAKLTGKSIKEIYNNL
jgi:16S rRNA (cytidine1402-2'-O)-methyltransferase